MYVYIRSVPYNNYSFPLCDPYIPRLLERFTFPYAVRTRFVSTSDILRNTSIPRVGVPCGRNRFQNIRLQCRRQTSAKAVFRLCIFNYKTSDGHCMRARRVRNRSQRCFDSISSPTCRLLFGPRQRSTYGCTGKSRKIHCKSHNGLVRTAENKHCET